MKMKAYIIHLERAADRVENIETIKRAISFLPLAVVAACDAQALDDAALSKHMKPRLHRPYYPFALSKGEIACFLSHRKAWQAIVDDDVDAGLVLEDDVAVTQDLATTLKLAAKLENKDFYLRLSHRDGHENGSLVAVENKSTIIRPFPVGLGTVGQLVSKKAAKHLLKITKRFDRPVDTFLQMPWVTGIWPLSARPSGIKDVAHMLGGSTLGKKRTLQAKLMRETMRPYYRFMISVYSRLHKGNA